MNTLRIDEYTDIEKAELEQLPLGTIELLLVKTQRTQENPLVSKWPVPNMVQFTWLLGLRDRLTNVRMAKPTTVQEQALLRGGAVEFTVVESTVKMTVTAVGSEPVPWVVEAIPVEERYLDRRPGLGRMCYFLAHYVKVKDGAYVPAIDVLKSKYEPLLIDPTGILQVCKILEGILVKLAHKRPQGASGQAMIDELYALLTLCSEEDYLGVHSMVLSYMLKIGKQNVNPATQTISMVPTPIYRETVKLWIEDRTSAGKEAKMIPYMRSLDLEERTLVQNTQAAFRHMPIIGYLTGDLPPTRKIAGTVVEATSCLLWLNAIFAGRGGTSTCASMITGKLGVGIYPPMFERMVEFLVVMWGLKERYNILGVTPVMAQIWQRSLKKFGGHDLAHNFAVPGTVTNYTSLYTIDGLPTVTFVYTSLDAFFRPVSTQTEDVRAALHGELFFAWLAQYFGNNRNIVVANMILPYGVPLGCSEEQREIKDRLKAYPIVMSPTARACFSQRQVSFGYEIAAAQPPKTNRGYKGGRAVMIREGSGYSPQSWGTRVLEEAWKVMALPIVQPRYSSTAYANLMPSFKDAPAYATVTGDWELHDGGEGTFRFTPPEGAPQDAAPALSRGTMQGPGVLTFNADGTPQINTNQPLVPVIADVPANVVAEINMALPPDN